MKNVKEMGHPQPLTAVQPDRLMANGLVKNKIQPKATKSIDIQFHQLYNHEVQHQSRSYWQPSKTNFAEY